MFSLRFYKNFAINKIWNYSCVKKYNVNYVKRKDISYFLKIINICTLNLFIFLKHGKDETFFIRSMDLILILLQSDTFVLFIIIITTLFRIHHFIFHLRTSKMQIMFTKRYSLIFNIPYSVPKSQHNWAQKWLSSLTRKR